MKLTLFKRFLGIICVAALILSAINTYFKFDLSRALLDALDPEYDYVISQDGSVFKAINQERYVTHLF